MARRERNSVRSQTPLGGWRKEDGEMGELAEFWKARQPVTLCIVAANIIVFLVLSFLGDTTDAQFMALHGAVYAPFILSHGEYYTLFTSMFLHFGVEHLFYNMLVLVFLGDTLEKMAGKVRFLFIYLAGGILGNVVSLLYDIYTDNYAVSAGASGAVFAVIGALVWCVILNKGRIQDYSGKRLLFMACLVLLQGFGSAGIDNTAHLGGFLAGFILAALFSRKLRDKTAAR